MVGGYKCMRKLLCKCRVETGIINKNINYWTESVNPKSQHTLDKLSRYMFYMIRKPPTQCGHLDWDCADDNGSSGEGMAMILALALWMAFENYPVWSSWLRLWQQQCVNHHVDGVEPRGQHWGCLGVFGYVFCCTKFIFWEELLLSTMDSSQGYIGQIDNPSKEG
jgi:hypothetical protein